jgi:hypothetical protein
VILQAGLQQTCLGFPAEVTPNASKSARQKWMATKNNKSFLDVMKASETFASYDFQGFARPGQIFPIGHCHLVERNGRPQAQLLLVYFAEPQEHMKVVTTMGVWSSWVLNRSPPPEGCSRPRGRAENYQKGKPFDKNAGQPRICAVPAPLETCLSVKASLCTMQEVDGQTMLMNSSKSLAYLGLCFF